MALLVLSGEAHAEDEAARQVVPPPRPVSSEPVEEVVVTGRREEPKTPTEHRLGRAEIRATPGAFGDAFRAIDVMPGVVPIVSGLPYFYVRGAPPSAVGYVVDDVRASRMLRGWAAARPRDL